MAKQESWGIIRYAPDTGNVPDEDVAAFDGWYSDREDPAAIFADWCVRYPGWIVAIVKQDEVRF